MTKTEQLLIEFKELKEGISNSRFAMHHREFYQAFGTGTKYLGDDIIYDAKGYEYNLFTDEKKQQIRNENHGGFGEYGLFFHSQKAELTGALAVLTTLKAREIIGEGLETVAKAKEDQQTILQHINLLDAYSVCLTKENVASILTTYPEGKITREMIKEATKTVEILIPA